MSRLIEVGSYRVTVIAGEIEDGCQMCGKIAETRPYGPGGKRICYDCGQSSDEMKAIIEHNIGIVLFGDKGELR